MNYTNTRQEAADKLKISVRSIDRYIKSGKLRSKKKGKIVYVNKEDIKLLKNGGNTNTEVIIPEKNSDKKENIEKNSLMGKDQINIEKTFENIYSNLKNEIKEKDELIQGLSIRVGKAEEIAKNSMSLVDFKKTQFLLEESKQSLSEEILDIKTEKEIIEIELKYEKNSNIILIFLTVILLLVSIGLWISTM